MISMMKPVQHSDRAFQVNISAQFEELYDEI